MKAQSIPEGYHTVTPYLLVEDVRALITFVKQAFDAVERGLHEGEDGRVMHAEVKIGNSIIMMGEPSEEWPPMPCMLHLYVDDTDAVYNQALEAGATSVREPQDEFYGDRSGGVRDSFGNLWWMATRVEEVSPEELKRRQAALELQRTGA